MGWSVNKESRMIYKIHLQRKLHIRHVGRKIPNDFNNDKYDACILGQRRTCIYKDGTPK